MRTDSFRRALVPGVAALALAVTGCSASNETENASADTGSGGAEISGDISAGGASTQQAAMGAWAVAFQDQHPDVTVNYDPIGSGGGRENFLSEAFPFAGTDAYLSEEDGELTMAAERCDGDYFTVPSYVSPIALAFNVDGVDALDLSPEVVAGIFAGTITSWDDPAIAETNPDADLPSAPINAVHRSDESGTTENFTEYLDAVASGQWDAGVIENWPTEYGGEAAKGTSGVVSAVKNGQNSIGYADASQVQDGLGVARVGVGDEFVEPSAEAASKILEVSERVEGRPDTDMAVDLDRTTEEAGTYPVVLTSYLVGCLSYGDQAEADQVKTFLEYVISDEGQQQAADEAGSAPLSDNLQEEATGILEQISAG